jgi:hypothetical protein
MCDSPSRRGGKGGEVLYNFEKVMSVVCMTHVCDLCVIHPLESGGGSSIVLF